MSAHQRELLFGATVFLCTLSIFNISRIHHLADSKYSMLVSESLLYHRSFSLEHYALPRNPPMPQPDYVSNGTEYHLELIGDRIFYYFPPGSSVLSLPFVALMNALGISAANPDGTYNPAGEIAIQHRLAALLMAALSVVLFLTARRLLPPATSMLVAVGAAFGTQMWSTASRGLWNDTWAILLLGLVILILVARETGGASIRPMLLATLLAWAYFVRPTNSISVAAVTVFVFLRHRREFMLYALTGVCWFAALVAYSWHHFGQALPNYFAAGRLRFETFTTAFLGNLISPSRGLLIHVPVLLFVAYLLARYRREIALPNLAIMAATVIMFHLIVVSGFSPWWGGHCFGPRYSTGLIPWFVLLAILGLNARLAQLAKRGAVIPFRAGQKGERLLGGTLLILSIIINGIGANSDAAARWNTRPVNIDQQPERVWDWSSPQFLAKWLN